MKWFISYMVYVDPRPQFPGVPTFRGWEPGNALIDEHPVEWARKTAAARLLFWSEVPDGPPPEERLASAFRTEEAVIAGLKALKEAGVQVPWSAMCVAARTMAEKAVEMSKRPLSRLDEEMRAKIDAHSDKLMLEAEPQLRALADATRITAGDLSARMTPPSECVCHETSSRNCPVHQNLGSRWSYCCDRNADQQPCDCAKEGL